MAQIVIRECYRSITEQRTDIFYHHIYYDIASKSYYKGDKTYKYQQGMVVTSNIETNWNYYLTHEILQIDQDIMQMAFFIGCIKCL